MPLDQIARVKEWENVTGAKETSRVWLCVCVCVYAGKLFTIGIKYNDEADAE